MIERRRLRAPQQDGGVLIEPPLHLLPGLVAANVAARSAQGAAASSPTRQAAARRETIDAALAYTRVYRDVAPPADGSNVLLSGHQPEMFHPGVWAKNFVLAGLARELNATAINLVVDGDTMKSASLRVPTGSADEPAVEALPFDGPAEAIPYEERTVVDRAVWASFGERVAAALRPWGIDPLMRRFWPEAVEAERATGRIGIAIARARHRLEATLGLQTLELPQGLLCDTAAFRDFLGALLADLPRFVEIHNTALREYRRAHRIRSANHPVPALECDGPWCEAPAWVWTVDAPQRRRLFVRRLGDGWELTDRDRVHLHAPHDSDGTALSEAMRAWSGRGVRIRSRALLTTSYARVVLGDLFIHGIGGAKYDELTDVLIDRYFGIRPPRFAVVTATRHLPLGDAARTAEFPDDATPRLWDLAHHPERYVELNGPDDAGDAERVRLLIDEKRRWIGIAPTRENARGRCLAIRAINDELRRWTGERRAEAERRERLRDAQVRRRRIRESREYGFPLFRESELFDFLLEINGRQRYLIDR